MSHKKRTSKLVCLVVLFVIFVVNSNLMATYKVTPKENNSICKICSTEFYVAKFRKEIGGGIYCSNKCRHKGLYKKVTKKCLSCETKMEVPPAREKNGYGKYCSLECRNKGKRGENNYNWKRRDTMSCLGCGKEFQYLNSPSLQARGGRKYCSNACLNEFAHKSGCENPNWRGGKREIIKVIRTSPEYHKWRDIVFKRDNYICTDCGYNKGHTLEAHHILPVYLLVQRFKIKTFDESLQCSELWNIDNGITLCEKCHMKQHRRI